MASKSSSVFSTEDRNLIRLRKMSEVVSSNTMRQLLRWLNPKWMPSMSFKDYLKTEKKVSMKAFNNILKPHQRVAVRTDPQGDTHDISLLYILLLWGNEGLADKEDDVWIKKSGCLEFLITSVKNVRNDLMHRYVPIGVKEFHDRIEELRNLLKDTINSAGSVCKHISQAQVDQALLEMNLLINKIRDDALDPKDFHDYKKQLMYPQQCDFVKNKGARALRIRHSKYSSLTPVSRLAKVIFPVDDVFTEMLLERGSGKKEKLELQDLLEDGNLSITADVMLVEGDAGVGKTTLTRKLLSDWTLKKGKIKYLSCFDLVIHAECREHIESFKALLESSMPEVSQSFQGEDMAFVILGLKLLIIIDGIDELNKKSANLFKEILQLKKDYDITVIVTSRPEAVEKYFQHAISYRIKTKHICLLGIPLEKREEFVKKYYDGMEKTGLSSQGIDGLLKYLKRTEHRLTHLWRLPYNITILTILWSMKPDVVNCITTAPELHWEIHQLSLSKLKDRLLDNELTQHLSSSALETKINHFMYILCQESLIALANDDITLPQVAYQRLEKICIELEIPVEEMTGSFLKKTITASGIRYGFPHKGLQDFLAAHFIWIRLTAPLISTDVLNIVKAFNDTLSKNAIPPHISRNILKLSARELKKANAQISTQKHQNFDAEKVEDMVESLLATHFVPEDMSQDICRFINERFNRNHQKSKCSPAETLTADSSITRMIQDEIGEIGLLGDTSKFQNMFISLIGIFYIDNSSLIENDTKMEALKFLQQTGIRDKDAWLNILNAVKCDQFVASFISKQPNILKGNISVTDSTLFAYISLIQALKPPLDDADEVKIVVDIKGDLAGVREFIMLISIHQFKEKKILINDGNFVQYTDLLQSLQTTLKNPSEVSLDVCLNQNSLLAIKELLEHIKRNKFTITKLQAPTLKIHDSNINDCISMVKCMSQIEEDANQVTFDIDIKGDLRGGVELLKLLNTYQLKVEKIVITEANFMDYFTVLKSLVSPFKNGYETEIEINTNEDIYTIRELLKEIKKNYFVVKRLNVKEKEILIDDSSVTEYLDIFKVLPTHLKDIYTGGIELNITGYTSQVSELMKEISIIGLSVKITFLHEFMFQTPHSILENIPSNVLNSCVITRYVGHMTPLIYLPNSLKGLYASVRDSVGYSSLQKFCEVNTSLKTIHLCLHRGIHVSSVGSVRKGDICYVNLYLPDLISKEDTTWAKSIMERIEGDHGTTLIETVFFPRARLNTQDIVDFIQQFEDDTILSLFVFPEWCKPEDLEDELRIFALFRDKSCEDKGISWNCESVTGNVFDDLNRWEP